VPRHAGILARSPGTVVNGQARAPFRRPPWAILTLAVALLLGAAPRHSSAASAPGVAATAAAPVATATMAVADPHEATAAATTATAPAATLALPGAHASGAGAPEVAATTAAPVATAGTAVVDPHEATAATTATAPAATLALPGAHASAAGAPGAAATTAAPVATPTKAAADPREAATAAATTATAPAATLAPAPTPVPSSASPEITALAAEGRRVQEVVFVYPGDKALKSRELRSAMRVQQGGRFSRRFFNSDLATILDLYRGRGYRNAQISRRTLILDQRGRVHATIELDSGPRWTVGQVVIDGGAPFSAAQLQAQVRLTPGSALNYGQVLEGERALQIFLNQRGYPHAVVRNEWSDHPDQHTADVVFHVDPSRRMYCGPITIENEGRLRTRRSLIDRYVTFDQGDLYNPEELARSRNLLVRTDLFRSVFFSTPETASGDSLQPIRIRLQERKFLRLEAQGLLSVADRQVEPRLTGGLQDLNWLGRGAQLGLNGSWGRPLQGGNIFWTERNLARTGADLTFSLGFTDEWTRTQVLGNPDDARQYDLLTANDSVLGGLLLFGGDEVAREYIRTVVYDYMSVQRLLRASSTLTRSWGELYRSHLSVTYARARTRPDASEAIRYTPSDLYGSSSGGDSTSTDSLWGDDGWLGKARAGRVAAPAGSDVYLDYSDGEIPVDSDWLSILTDRSRAIDLSLEFQRDSRDDRIAPTRGSFLRATSLYAIELGARSTYVLDGELEGRHYQPVSRHAVVAVAGQVTQTGSLREGRSLPQVYWKRYGGEGSLRGVQRNLIQAIGGGRLGVNLRSELRLQAGAIGLVGFWDRANVWRRNSEFSPRDLVRLSRMVDGYGLGVRYSAGFPFRLDVAFNDGFDPTQTTWVYFSIGQAF
jgi:outer membrane protein assembly factor BamA